MAQHPRAGTPATPADLVDLSRLVTKYYTEHPDVTEASQQVAFGTSGHRGSSLRRSFNDDHIAATTQAICDYRAAQGFDGPLFLGKDTHALSEPAFVTAMEVLAANEVTVLVDPDARRGRGYTPTPALSHAILAANRGKRLSGSSRGTGLADGIVITPSHNPPADGGFKYNPPNGGPADTDITGWVQDRANALLAAGMPTGADGVRRMSIDAAWAAQTTDTYDYLGGYVADLPNVLDLAAIRAAGVRIGADPLGGAAVDYWGRIGEEHGLDLEVVNPDVDGTFRFMTLDWDAKIRMDCSSPSAMASLIGTVQADPDRYEVATGNDADADRHGIVTRDAGLMNPNHFLSVAIDYLAGHREGWSTDAGIGKTLVSSSMIDRVVTGMGRRLVEVPVGFKWFVPGLLDGSILFGGEESAGASFLRHDGTVWTTDKDGILLCLLASEITAVLDRSPSQRYAELTQAYGEPVYARVDAPATREEKSVLARLSPDQVRATSLAGDPITATLTEAPGNGAAIGGLKVVTENGWFAARPSGTEDVYKIYAESFLGADHLARIQAEARQVVGEALAG